MTALTATTNEWFSPPRLALSNASSRHLIFSSRASPNRPQIAQKVLFLISSHISLCAATPRGVNRVGLSLNVRWPFFAPGFRTDFAFQTRTTSTFLMRSWSTQLFYHLAKPQTTLSHGPTYVIHFIAACRSRMANDHFLHTGHLLVQRGAVKGWHAQYDSRCNEWRRPRFTISRWLCREHVSTVYWPLCWR